MKIAALVLLILPAIVLAETARPPEFVPVAVFDFEVDGNIPDQFGGRNAGVTLAMLVANDLSLLPPLRAIDPDTMRRKMGTKGLDLTKPLSTAEVRDIGLAVGATALVNGRIYASSQGIIVAAKVISLTTGETLGTMVTTRDSSPLADLIALLGIQIGKIVLIRQGVAPPSWAPAAISGSGKPGSLFRHDEVACIVDIDGKSIPDETKYWSVKRSLLPGRHDIYVRYYDGTSLADHGFVFDAKPGASYVVSYQKGPDQKARLWIQDQTLQQPVTPVEEVIRSGVKETGAWPFGVGIHIDNRNMYQQPQRGK